MKKALATLAIAISLAVHAAWASELAVSAGDTMQFDKTELTAEAGKQISLSFTNHGKLPKAAMGHNLVILKPGTELAPFANAAIAAAANEYIPTDAAHSANIVAHTKLLGPGESDVITVTFSAPGTYPFICSFPGHWGIMKGTITVK